MPAFANYFHCSVKTVSRKTGRSAVAAAAYRLGKDLVDRELSASPYGDAVAAAAYRAGIDLKSDDTVIARYSGRAAGIVTWFIVAPEGSPEWAYDPEELWNHAMSKDKRVNSNTAREVELALPAVLTPEERQQLALDYAEDLVDRYGVAVQVAIHKPSVRGDQRNYHAHILFTTRRMGPDGLTEKTRELDETYGRGPGEVEWIREHASDLMNEALERAGHSERVTHLSFEDRGLDREASFHLGPDATEMERKGQSTELGDKNREIAERNRAQEDIEAALAEYAELEREIIAARERELDARYGKIEKEASEQPQQEPGPQHEETAKAPKDTDPPLNDEDRIIEEESVYFDEQIRQTGGVQQEGLAGLHWSVWFALTEIAVELVDRAVSYVVDKWQEYIANRTAQHDIDRDEPDMEL